MDGIMRLVGIHKEREGSPWGEGSAPPLPSFTPHSSSFNVAVPWQVSLALKKLESAPYTGNLARGRDASSDQFPPPGWGW